MVSIYCLECMITSFAKEVLLKKRDKMKKQGNEGRKVLKPSPNEEVC